MYIATSQFSGSNNIQRLDVGDNLAGMEDLMD